jgi:signal transduction histidine kinase
MTERERVEGMLIESRLNELRDTVRTLETVETTLESLRETKWALVNELKELGHNFKTTCEGMDIVLSAPPSMRF